MYNSPGVAGLCMDRYVAAPPCINTSLMLQTILQDSTSWSYLLLSAALFTRDFIDEYIVHVILPQAKLCHGLPVCSPPLRCTGAGEFSSSTSTVEDDTKGGNYKSNEPGDQLKHHRNEFHCSPAALPGREYIDATSGLR